MLQYKVKSDKIINLFKTEINQLNSGNMKFDLIDYNDESLSLRCHLHIISLKFKQEGEMVNVIISFTFEGGGGEAGGLAQNFSSVGGDRAACRIVEFINEKLDTSEITESATQYLLEKQSNVKQGYSNMAIWAVGFVALFFIIYFITMSSL